MKNLILKKGYKPLLGVRETEKAIKLIKTVFEKNLSDALNLERISAPLIVSAESGLNDNLNGVERIVTFPIKEIKGIKGEVVQSLAKWKRYALNKYGFKPGEGLYTNMNAIRCDDLIDSLHSVYVDQWDWERVITKQERNIDFLKSIVTKIVGAVIGTLDQVKKNYPVITLKLSDDIKFITTQELEDLYPDKTPKQREYEIVKQYKTVFIMQIGGVLRSGAKHDGRASDYDDWTLNGDIFFYDEFIDTALELSSMGIRVDAESLDYQLSVSGNDDRRKYEFHKMILDDEMVLTIGGGIGQSRLCMLLLEKMHIGEVQVSIWPDDMINACNEHGIKLL
ncbi:MAG: aspartate--ammonia ligase [Christensenellales bacterium]|jgi:aspartate--ammonia ligase